MTLFVIVYATKDLTTEVLPEAFVSLQEANSHIKLRLQEFKDHSIYDYDVHTVTVYS